MATRFCFAFVLLFLSAARIAAGDARPVRPGRDGAPLAATLDASTVYVTSLGGDGIHFVFGTDPPRNPLWGEHVTLHAPGSIPLSIRSIEFGVNVTAQARLVAQFDVWDAYDTAATPVNSGLLGTAERDFGTLAADVQGEFHEGLVVPVVPPLILSDPDVFVAFVFKSDVGATPPNRVFRPIADGSPYGPVLGDSENDLYVDQDGDGIFTDSALNAGDRRRIDNPALCGPGNCHTNWLLQIRGERDPLVIDPGSDLLETAGGLTSAFLGDYLYPGFFDFDDDGNFCVPPGFGSSDGVAPPFPLAGTPLATNPAAALGSADTIVERLQLADLRAVASQTIPAALRALSMEGTFVVTYDGGQSPTTWKMHVCLSDYALQAEGTLTLRRGECGSEGGTYDALIPVQPRLIFEQIAPPPTPPCHGITFDFGANGIPPEILTLSGGHWLADAPGALAIAESAAPVAIDSTCDGVFDPATVPPTSNFHPALRVPRCASETGCTGRAPVRRSERWTSPILTQSFLPASSSAASDGDADGLPDDADNCPGTPNPAQSDGDGDALGDFCDRCPTICGFDFVDDDLDGYPNACDNCPEVFNGNQVNLDGDAFGDACDCAPFDTQNDGPDEAAGLRFTAPPPDKTAFAWDATPFASGYQLLSGSIDALPVGPGGGDETCLGTPAGTSWNDATLPASGQGLFYLVRAVDGCAPAPDYGGGRSVAGATTPRQTTTCP